MYYSLQGYGDYEINGVDYEICEVIVGRGAEGGDRRMGKRGEEEGRRREGGWRRVSVP
jgi:hypothetical protein